MVFTRVIPQLDFHGSQEATAHSLETTAQLTNDNMIYAEILRHSPSFQRK